MFGINTFSGFAIIEVATMVKYAGEDWSKVRSPARARRRRKKHRQNITTLYEPDGQFLVDQKASRIYCHPMMAKALMARAQQSGRA